MAREIRLEVLVAGIAAAAVACKPEALPSPRTVEEIAAHEPDIAAALGFPLEQFRETCRNRVAEENLDECASARRRDDAMMYWCNRLTRVNEASENTADAKVQASWRCMKRLGVSKYSPGTSPSHGGVERHYVERQEYQTPQCREMVQKALPLWELASRCSSDEECIELDGAMQGLACNVFVSRKRYEAANELRGLGVRWQEAAKAGCSAASGTLCLRWTEGAACIAGHCTVAFLKEDPDAARLIWEHRGEATAK